jgi:hypothetical protein
MYEIVWDKLKNVMLKPSCRNTTEDSHASPIPTSNDKILDFLQVHMPSAILKSDENYVSETLQMQCICIGWNIDEN